MKHVRFATMDAVFVQTTVRAWPALRSQEGSDAVVDSFLDAGRALRRSGVGPLLVYVLGGCGHETELSTLDVYDPMTDGWKQVSSMPTERFQHGAVALAGKIYVVGGCRDENTALSTADVYDPQSNSWQPLADMACGRSSFAAAVAGGKVYAIGGEIADGEDDIVPTEMVEAFDPQLGAWADVSSMSVDRSQHAVAVVHGKIYAIGGINSEYEALDSVEVFDPQADSWQQVPSMPHGRCCHAAATLGGKIYVSGGTVADGNTGLFNGTVLVYDPQVNTWTELTSMGTVRRCHTSAAIGGSYMSLAGKKLTRA